MLNIIITSLLLSGTAIMVAALFPLNRLMEQLPPGGISRKWLILLVMVCCFIIGYIGYTALNWNSPKVTADLVVTIILFLGAIFVLLVSILSLQTTINVMRLATLEKENITDPLMGIYNRRHMEFQLKQEIMRSHRYAEPLSVLLMDVDHFKKINDHYGHPVGDKVLQGLGQLILAAVRETDVVARYGGEEILLITPHTALKLAASLAERLRTTIENTVLVPRDDTTGQEEVSITVSIGVSGIYNTAIDYETLLEYTDQALYQAKHNGRNQVVVDERGVVKNPVQT